MKITRIELYHVTAPLPAPFRPSWIPGMAQTENRFDLIRICTASGLDGWSAAPALGRERTGWGDLLGSYFLGERADDIANVRQRIREMGYLGLRAGWIEPACWDIVGKARGKPVYELLGGSGGSVKLYASTGEVKSGPDRVKEVEDRLADGFEAVKLRVHADELADDVSQIRTVRREVGDEVVLGVDANMAWRVAAVADCAGWDWDRAFAFCSEAEQLGFAWVEEPLPMDDYAGLAKLRAATEIGISGGELNGHGLPEFRVMLEKGCYDTYQPDAVMMAGGLSETWAIIEAVTAAGAAYTPHTWTNGIGFAVNLQLFGALERADDYLEYPYSPPGWLPVGRDALLTEPWLHEKGRLELPTRPGLGFEIDHDQLKRHAKRVFTATKPRVAVTAIRGRGLRETLRLSKIRDAWLSERDATLDSEHAAGRDPTLEFLHGQNQS